MLGYPYVNQVVSAVTSVVHPGDRPGLVHKLPSTRRVPSSNWATAFKISGFVRIQNALRPQKHVSRGDEKVRWNHTSLRYILDTVGALGSVVR
jgi:hypothetical protein